MRVVVRVQADLAGDLGLASLAAEAGLSRAHFQRAFTTAVGASPSSYVVRVRVERAAFLLRVRQATLLEIALSVGFTNPDTFTRAFRRRFGVTPSAYRRTGASSAGHVPPERGLAESSEGFSLSPTRVVRVRELGVAFLRQVGPYEDVDCGMWSRLLAWAREQRIVHGGCVGIGHDAPSATAPGDLRFDAGILVGPSVRARAGVGIQVLPAGLYAATTHVGMYGTLPRAYPQIFARASSLEGHRLVGLPVVEIYHDATIDLSRPLSVTDVLLPVVRAP